MSVTRLGVSLLKVVATIERPASHQGTERPDAKNSDVLLPARLPKNRAGHEADEHAEDGDDPVEGWSMHECVSVSGPIVTLPTQPRLLRGYFRRDFA